MASGGGVIDPETKEAYYLRIHFLLVHEGTSILKAVFDHYVPPSQLQATLLKYSATIQKAKKGNIIVRANYHLLDPNQNQPDSKTFDISLFFYLLRTISGLNKKSQWWNEKENNNIPDSVVDVEADIVRMINVRNKMQHKTTAFLEQLEFLAMWDLLEKVLLRLAAICNISQSDQQQKIDAVKTRKHDLVSLEMRNLREHSEKFLEDYKDRKQYVETSAYRKAKHILEKKRIVVLTGHPGEGKTAMAARLALDLSPINNCVNLPGPSDWRMLSPELVLRLMNIVIIDNIFGDGALDLVLVNEWKRYLRELERAATRKGNIRIIITSRHYIFEESKEAISSLPDMFKEKNGCVLHLTSSDLSHDERHNILNVIATRNEKDLSGKIINDCIKASVGRSEGGEKFLFGFPECASMFVRNSEMFETGAEFFKKPASFFKRCLEELYKGEKRKMFNALVTVWVQENKRLSQDELSEVTTVSKHVKRMVSAMGSDLNEEFLDMMRSCLDSHVGGYLVFNEKTEEYTFSHNIIGDMVGIVVGNKNLKRSIKLCPRDFLMERVVVDELPHDEFKVTVKEGNMRCLAEKCTNMILRRGCNELAEIPDVDEFQKLQRWGQRSNVINVANRIDFGMIKHKAFRSTKFVNEFIDHVIKMELIPNVFSVPVMTMKGYFLDYGISMQKLDMCLMGYAWYSGAFVFAKEVIRREIMEMENFDPTVSLLLAVHSKERKSIQFLLENGAKVTGDVIYIAAHRSTELLNMLLQHPDVDVNDRGHAINGNYPLIVAARKGLREAVSCMLTFGADTGVQNTAKMTALHKAILYKHAKIIKALLEAGSPLDIRGGKYKRTPLHLAVDLGNEALVNQLINKGASLTVKDYRGQYPIHLAAIHGNVKIVERLYLFDKTQETLRISSYGRQSMIKGMSLFHVAIWKKNVRLLKALIDMEVSPNIQDFYGQTPLFFAIMKGHADLANKLLDYPKTDKRKSQKQGYTPLHAAIHKELPKVARKLMKHSNVNAVDRFGKTPLHEACDKLNIGLIKKLLECGADPRQITKSGDTVFHLLKRKKNRTSLKNVEESKSAEQLLADWDPDFVDMLPSLNNKTGAVVKLHYRPTGLSRKQLLLQKSDSSNASSGDTSEDENCSSVEESFADSSGDNDQEDDDGDSADDDDNDDDYEDDNDNEYMDEEMHWDTDDGTDDEDSDDFI